MDLAWADKSKMDFKGIKVRMKDLDDVFIPLYCGRSVFRWKRITTLLISGSPTCRWSLNLLIKNI